MQQGTRLADRIRDHGRLRPDDAALLLLPVAEELERLHQAGVVHGAVSPSAIVIGPDGRAHLAERAGVVVDPDYMPPGPDRSWRPRSADDVWSLAAVLSALTTGNPPTGAPAPRAAGWLTPITELALAPDDRDRPTMGELVDYLRARATRPATAELTASPPTGEAHPRRRLLAAAVAVVAVFALLGATLLLAGGDDRRPAPEAEPSSTAPTSTGSPRARPSATASAPQVTEAELIAFARSYVATASRDPEQGFALLTPDYQDASPRYREVWRSIRSPRILRVGADPATLSVTYTYRYTQSGGRQRTETVTLRLVKRDDRLLIAGATAA